jgi:hypothetical protein
MKSAENRMWRKTFGRRREELKEEKEKRAIKIIMICILNKRKL